MASGLFGNVESFLTPLVDSFTKTQPSTASLTQNTLTPFAGSANTQPAGYVQDALNKPFTFTNTSAATNPGQIQQQAADTAYQSATRYLDPQFQRQQAGLESQLANQGITRGSEAWNNAMNQFGENKNQAYEQARSQAYTQGLGGANQALNTMFQQGQLDVARENAAKMADAMKTGGMYSLGGALLGSPTGLSGLGSLVKGAGSGIGSLLSGIGNLGGLFSTGGANTALPDWAQGITDPETLKALGFGDSAGAAGGFDPTGGYLTALLAADKLSGGKIGVAKTASDLIGGAGNAVSDAVSGLGGAVSDVFGW